jgi:RNA polymerase sigma factor (sigma-70 family)
MTPAKRAPKAKTAKIAPVSTTGPNAEIDSLVRRCLRGDQLAWDTIVRTYRRKVFNVAYKFVAKHDEAEDLTQEIFIKVFKSLKTFDRRANFQTWLVSISRNMCIDHYRAVRKERQTIDRNIDADVLKPVAIELPPIFRIEQRDRVELLREALKELQPMLRTAIIMRDLQEMSYSEIAAELHLPEGTVKSRINRGRIELALQIKRMRGEQYRPSDESTPSDTSRLPGAYK